MQYALQVFEYQDQREFRTLDIDGEPWFVLADVCRAMDLQAKNGSFSHHAERLDPDERRLVARSIVDEGPSPSKGEGEITAPVGASLLMINESGLFSLVLTSNKPEAKRFKRWVTSEVLPSIRRTGGYGRSSQMPAFIKRYNQNWNRVAVGYFSVISELVVRLWGRLEQVGYVMADKAADGKEMRPDVSVGRLFSEWLQEYHPEAADEYTYYLHWTPQGEFEARQYVNTMWPLFIEFVDTVWIPKHSERYFSSRDPAALPHLPKLLPPAEPRPAPRKRVSRSR